MSKVDLARRSGVSLPTLHRLFSAREQRPRADTLAALAVALGVELRLSASLQLHEIEDVFSFREQQARKKARHLTKLVCGTMALEAEALDARALFGMEEQCVHELLAGPARRLWGA